MGKDYLKRDSSVPVKPAVCGGGAFIFGDFFIESLKFLKVNTTPTLFYDNIEVIKENDKLTRYLDKYLKDREI